MNKVYKNLNGTYVLFKEDGLFEIVNEELTWHDFGTIEKFHSRYTAEVPTTLEELPVNISDYFRTLLTVPKQGLSG